MVGCKQFRNPHSEFRIVVSSPGGTRTGSTNTELNRDFAPERSNNVTISVLDDDPRLALVVDRWPDLPESTKSEVVAMVTEADDPLE